MCTCYNRTEFKASHVYTGYLHSFKSILLKNPKFKNKIKNDGPLLSLGSIANISSKCSLLIICYSRNAHLWIRASWLISFILMKCNDTCTQSVSTRCSNRFIPNDNSLSFKKGDAIYLIIKLSNCITHNLHIWCEDLSYQIYLALLYKKYT